MKLSIIIEDGAVVEDGDGHVGLTFTSPPEVRALQWSGVVGHIEIYGEKQQKISSLPQWALDAIVIKNSVEQEPTAVTYDGQDVYDFEATLIEVDVSDLTSLDFTYIKISAHKSYLDFRTVGVNVDAIQNLSGSGSGQAVASMKKLHLAADKLGIPIMGQVSLPDPIKNAQWLSVLNSQLMLSIGNLPSGAMYVCRLPQPLSAKNQSDKKNEDDMRLMSSNNLDLSLLVVDLVGVLVSSNIVARSDLSPKTRITYDNIKLVTDRVKL